MIINCLCVFVSPTVGAGLQSDRFSLTFKWFTSFDEYEVLIPVTKPVHEFVFETRFFFIQKRLDSLSEAYSTYYYSSEISCKDGSGAHWFPYGRDCRDVLDKPLSEAISSNRTFTDVQVKR